jgi:DNA-binding NarL/FixJ family response regulator
VDDHGAWRRHIAAVLRTSRTWDIAGEAGNGTAAVEAAAALAPDLILLDVELPGLNGIEAARLIVASAPEQKILFVSNHRSLDVVEAAFEAGARGYVLKTHASDELLPAMTAVAAGRRFISARFLAPAADGRAPASADPGDRHRAGFYSQPGFLLDDLASFVASRLTEGHGVIAVTTAGRRDELYRRLEDRLDIRLAVNQGRYVWMDDEATLSGMMVDGRLDETRFWRNATALILQAARRSRSDPARVSVCGEGCSEHLRVGTPGATVRLEELCGDLSAAFNVDMLCGYLTSSFPPGEHDAVRRIAAAHASVITR